MTAGPIIAGLGMATLYSLKPGSSYLLHVLPGVLIFSAGLVLTVAPLTTTVMTSVEDSYSGIASGINNAISRAAGVIVIAFLGLFGASNFYHFSMALCALLAISSGFVSYAFIRTTKPARITARQ